jgi:hypothetical protein
MRISVLVPRARLLPAALAITIVASLAHAPTAAAATPVETKPVTMSVALVDMRAESAAAVAGKASELSREGVVLVFEGIDADATADVVRAATADAIASGYVLRAAIRAAATTEPRVIVYAFDGPHSAAIPASTSMKSEVVVRSNEVGKGMAGAQARQASASAQSSGTAESTDEPESAKRRCRKEGELGSRLRTRTVCTSDRSERRTRDQAQGIQDRGIANNDPNMGGG